jgi:hypothetical protein
MALTVQHAWTSNYRTLIGLPLIVGRTLIGLPLIVGHSLDYL